MCQCPEPIEPPNTTIRNCRYILQGLAAGLLVLTVFSIFTGDIISMIYFLMFIYLLFLSWTQFNWCTTLFFFLFSSLQFIFSTIILIGMYILHDLASPTGTSSIISTNLSPPKSFQKLSSSPQPSSLATMPTNTSNTMEWMEWELWYSKSTQTRRIINDLKSRDRERTGKRREEEMRRRMKENISKVRGLDSIENDK